MRQIVVASFGGPEQIQLVEMPTPEPALGQVQVRLTSIGIHQADLLDR